MRAFPAERRNDAALFLLSTAVLALEVLQTKIFAFTFDPLMVYLAVAVCMLGLSGGATLVAVLPRSGGGFPSALAPAAAAAGSLALVASHALFARLSPAIPEGNAKGVLTLLALTAPYLAFGTTIALLLAARGPTVGKAYAVNLAGSGLGCLSVFPLLEGLGAERTLVVLAMVPVAAAALLLPTGSRAPRVGLALLAAAIAACAIPVGALFPFQPDGSGQLGMILARAAELDRRTPGAVSVTHLHGRWDRTSRIDVYRLDSETPELRSRVGGPLETLFFVQDASAGSILLGVGADATRGRAFFDETVYGAGYAAGPRRSVLIVGLGGAPDVLAALYHGASRIVGVEINRSTLEMVRGPFREFLGDPYARPEVRIEQVDGRTFLRSSRETFDLIQMSGVDTKSVFYASGSLSLNETYLYTRESMVETLRRLAPSGLLAVNRFGDQEMERMTSLAIAGLQDLGAADPSRHLIAIRQGVWRCLLVKREPFSPEEIASVAAWAGRNPTGPDIVIPTYDWINVSFRFPLTIDFAPPPLAIAAGPFYEALARGGLDAYVAASRFDLSPPTDDRPFFFFQAKPQDALRWFPPLLAMIRRIVIALVAVSTALIVVPLVVSRRRGLAIPGAAPAVAYFCGLGGGFLFAEIGLIQRFIVLLGHQGYAITVVLFGLLAGAGLGSAWSARLPRGRPGPLRVALGAAAALIVAYAYVLGPVFSAAAGLPFAARLVLALALLVGLGFPLGIPFPTALRELDAGAPALVPWAIGVNGFASVLGGILAVPVAMLAGFRTLLFVAAAAYLSALWTAPRKAG